MMKKRSFANGAKMSLRMTTILRFERRADMKTTKFLLDYLRETAQVTINNTRGEILYEGQLGEMPIALVRGTIVNRIDGLGTMGDILIEIANA
jgi:hypothetical protein